MSKVDEFEKDAKRLADEGLLLYYAIFNDHEDAKNKKAIPANVAPHLPMFAAEYQQWYSESLALISQVLPKRLEDFRSYYTSKLVRKEITNANYTISDCLKGLSSTTYNGTVKFDPISANTAMYQQYQIVAGLKNRFKSTLYDIRTLVHADLLDDELHAADVLNKNGFQRGAGAVAGVVLEGHLGAVCERHQVKLKPKPTISTFNDALKDASVMDIAQWRFVQHLGDIRNKCDHKTAVEPTKDEVTELIEGVRKITKTVL